MARLEKRPSTAIENISNRKRQPTTNERNSACSISEASAKPRHRIFRRKDKRLRKSFDKDSVYVRRQVHAGYLADGCQQEEQSTQRGSTVEPAVPAKRKRSPAARDPSSEEEKRVALTGDVVIAADGEPKEERSAPHHTAAPMPSGGLQYQAATRRLCFAAGMSRRGSRPRFSLSRLRDGGKMKAPPLPRMVRSLALEGSPLLLNLGKANANAYWLDLTVCEHASLNDLIDNGYQMRVTFNAQKRTARTYNTGAVGGMEDRLGDTRGVRIVVRASRSGASRYSCSEPC
ncbi:hypothetical protein WOLCODRAFT_143819, partial [Wolfiporia cocos MD-104 SS10]